MKFTFFSKHHQDQATYNKLKEKYEKTLSSFESATQGLNKPDINDQHQALLDHVNDHFNKMIKRADVTWALYLATLNSLIRFEQIPEKTQKVEEVIKKFKDDIDSYQTTIENSINEIDGKLRELKLHVNEENVLDIITPKERRNAL